jgi:hypothetical protein
MKNEGLGLTAEVLLNSPELLVGVVDATVIADFGLTVNSFYFVCCGASFLAFALKKVD